MPDKKPVRRLEIINGFEIERIVEPLPSDPVPPSPAVANRVSRDMDAEVTTIHQRLTRRERILLEANDFLKREVSIFREYLAVVAPKSARSATAEIREMRKQNADKFPLKKVA